MKFNSKSIIFYKSEVCKEKFDYFLTQKMDLKSIFSNSIASTIFKSRSLLLI